MSTNKIKMDIQTLIILMLVGLLAGMLSGLVGIGGGIIIVPALVYLAGFSQFTAQGTSLALLMFPVGVLGVIQYYRQGHVNFSVVGILAAGFVAGSFLGSKISLSLNQETIRKIFALLLLILGAKMLLFDKPDASGKVKAKTVSANVEKRDD